MFIVFDSFLSFVFFCSIFILFNVYNWSLKISPALVMIQQKVSFDLDTSILHRLHILLCGFVLNFSDAFSWILAQIIAELERGMAFNFFNLLTIPVQHYLIFHEIGCRKKHKKIKTNYSHKNIG